MTQPTSTPHHLIEDAQAFALGTAMAALGVTMLTHLGLITGQTAGLAVLLSYGLDLPFGWVFFTINLPFYALAWLRMGPVFTAKSFVCVALVSLFASVFPDLIVFAHLDALLGAILVGAVTGLGLIVLFRHGASLGGIGVLALYLQDKTGFRAGYSQLLFDLGLFGAAFALIAPDLVLYSLAGAVVANLIIATNHRPDRYTGR